MSTRRVHLSAGIAAAAVTGILGLAVAANAHADNTIDINGWTVDTDGSPDSSATLLDPSNALGVGAQVTGNSISLPYETQVLELNQTFDSGAIGSQTAPFIDIRDQWLTPSFLESTLNGNDGTTGGATEGFFETNLGGNEVVDLYNAPGAYVPLVNPDATGTVDVGGVALAAPQDGALFNDIFEALATGSSADWANAATLFGDLFSF